MQLIQGLEALRRPNKVWVVIGSGIFVKQALKVFSYRLLIWTRASTLIYLYKVFVLSQCKETCLKTIMPQQPLSLFFISGNLCILRSINYPKCHNYDMQQNTFLYLSYVVKAFLWRWYLENTKHNFITQLCPITASHTNITVSCIYMLRVSQYCQNNKSS